MAGKGAKKKMEKVAGFEFEDIIYEKGAGVARITINRPEVSMLCGAKRLTR